MRKPSNIPIPPITVMLHMKILIINVIRILTVVGRGEEPNIYAEMLRPEGKSASER